MLKVGDIIKDISESHGDCDLTGIIVDAAVVMDKPVFFVRFFGDDTGDLIPLYSYEIQKVS